MSEVAESKPLDVKEAARVATAYLLDLLGQDDIEDVRLEEVERTPGNGFWLVTLGYTRRLPAPDGQPPSVVSLLRGHPPREYKVFTIDAHTGDVTSMKIRQP